MRALSRGSGIAMVLVGILLACDKSPSPPTAPSGGNNTPKILQAVSISGPDTVPPGQTAQFNATASYTDGSSEDVTKTATWRTGRSTVLTIASGGLATARDVGESSVTVSFSNRTATKGDVVVTPAGTFRLSGSVRDSGLLISGAVVRIMSGPSQGLTTTTTLGGTYKLYGVAGDSEILVTKDGYDDARQHFNVTQSIAVDFNMILSKPRQTIGGTYTLKISAAPECTLLLSEVRQRTYTAIVTQDGPRLKVVLQDANFYKNGGIALNTFLGTVEPSRISFTPFTGGAYYGVYYYLPDVLEQLSSASSFSFGGTTTVTPTPTGFSGALSGVLVVMSTPQLRPLSNCSSSNHRFELVR